MNAMRASTMLALVTVLLGGAQVFAADAAKVLNVIAVKVKPGDQDAYLEKVKKLNALVKKSESGGTLRVWRAAVAGADTGMIYVGIEYADLEAYAKSVSKLQASEDWKKQMKDLDASGLREVLGSSLLVEVTP